MSAAAPQTAGHQRLLTFEVGGAAYAMPISGVLEVAEVEEVACVPTLSPGVAGVVNHHGDALPLVDRAVLLELDAALPEPVNILVVSAGPDAPRLGLPVDRVLGLVDGPAAAPGRAGPVAERRSVDGRVVNILDPEWLVTRARQVIERASAPAE